MKKISILGSTGSIGTQALDVVRKHRDQFEIVALSAHRNVKLLFSQVAEFRPKTICISDSVTGSEAVKNLPPGNIEILSGRDGLLELAGRDNVDILLNGLVGSSGMEPTIRAISAGVNVALSNKESLVLAGGVITGLQRKNGVKILPVDSEHSAIWQCLVGEQHDQIRRLILTGSGGPFRTRPIDTFSTITIEDALRHPNWKMGEKITVDSATMMNKGLEVIEARWLFDIPASQVDIVVHPQSIIHSMVEFVDGSVKAQLGYPEMKIPIQYSLTYPDHAPVSWKHFDPVSIGQLTFEKPDLHKFPCISLAYEAINSGGSYPAVLNVANDLAVYAFLQKKISFIEIPGVIELAMSSHNPVNDPDVEQIRELMAWTTQFLNSKLQG